MGVALYRKHRPRTFQQVIGQEHVIRTLGNAIEQGRIHHAYLFIGGRGSGKTSLAKIFAAALNVEGGPRMDFSPDDPVVEAVALDEYLDVMEIDAASNSSLDAMAEIKATVGDGHGVEFKPILGNYKVYILDEVHMLTDEAWNSMLKTLEEPPPYTIFVLATTEGHLIPQTIADRCQRFYFDVPGREAIIQGVRRVAALEGIGIAEDALIVLSRAANGSFRNALGSLEQLLTYTADGYIERHHVYEILKISDEDRIFEAIESFSQGDPKAMVDTIERVAASGKSLVQFLDDLTVYLRYLHLVRLYGEAPDEIVVEEQRQHFIAWAGMLTDGQILSAYDILMQERRNLLPDVDTRMQVEMALMIALATMHDQGFA